MKMMNEDVEKFEERGVASSIEVVPYGQDPKWLAKKKVQNPFLETIERLARLPDVDPAKLKQIIDMQEQVLDRNAKQAFNAAMTKAQNKIELVVAKEWNDQTRSYYADLKAVLIQAKPIYTAEGFSLMFYEGDTTKENHKRVCVDIMHEQGHTEKRFGDFAVQTTGMGGKTMMTQIHGEGSCFSYGRRYLTCMIFNIPTGDDDDGNKAGGKIKVEYINDQQFSSLTDMMNEVKADVPKFLKYFKIDDLGKLPARRFDEAWKMLEKKKK
jgi:hypothetical protein